MIRGLAFLGAAVAAAASPARAAQPPPDAPAPAPTPNETCRVLEAAYTAAVDSRRLASPVDVRPSWRALELAGFDREYVRVMALGPGEFEDLRDRNTASAAGSFLPDCQWDGFPTPAGHDDHRMWVSFTGTVFSTDGRLAIVEVSFLETSWGYGRMCIVRRGEAGWAARCLPSWVT